MEAALLHLSWRRNGDRFDVAVAANRLLARGVKLWLALHDSAGIEAGDYIIDAPAGCAERLARLGLSTSALPGPLPLGAAPLAPVRIAVLAGTASAYPYYAYYALALTRLGFSFQVLDGAAIAAGGLDDANLFILPGGFANWGLDAEEESPGADAAVRDFLARGGACIGSCGGAFYLSAGRPCWTGTARARPRFTHEYLRTGVGIVTCALTDSHIGLGLPRTLEIPYYHGPVYDELGRGVSALGSFQELYASGRLFIDNPLDEERFARNMAGRTAILQAEGPRGRAILFSPHPEMGDLVRKYMALEDYVRHYLPIRGRHIMEQTLAFYRPLESPSFRLVLNAMHGLMSDGKAARAIAVRNACADSEAAREALRRLAAEAARKLKEITFATDDYGELQAWLSDRLATRIEPAAQRLMGIFERPTKGGEEAHRILAAWIALAEHALAGWRQPNDTRRPAERMLEVELALCLIEAWAGLAEFDLALA